MDLTTLREQHPIFTYHSYEYEVTANSLRLTFDFSISPDIHFHPEVTIEGISTSHLGTLSPQHLSTLIFHLGLIEIPTYWKATCSPLIKVDAGHLSEDQSKWWQKLLLNGLGEFFYRNQIDFTGEEFVAIQAAEEKKDKDTRIQGNEETKRQRNKETVLVPLGGGKDSIVTLELLKQSGVDVVPFALNPIVAVTELLKLNPTLTPVIARRTIDPTLLELNRQGYLNGHTPFSAYLAFLTYFVATLKDIPQIALSNERSASEGNVEYLGTVVNHQYSKSLEFENDFRNYVANYLQPTTDNPQPNYFSFLRPLHELQIGKLFAELTTDNSKLLTHNSQLKTIFRSCNRGQKTNTWCGECSKCLFAWLMLFPFLGETELISIFGQNLFEKESLIDEALNLIHPERVKPWECVGTREESQVALYLSSKRYSFDYTQDDVAESKPLPLMLERIKQEIANVSDQDAARLLNDWNTENNLPSEFEALLTQKLVH